MKRIFILLMPFVLFSCACTNPNNETQNEPGFKLDKTELTISVGNTETIKVIEAPLIDGATLEWSSNNNDVAKVANGVITALSSGNANITATYGELTASCIVTVPERKYALVWEENFNGTSLNSENWNIEVNGSGGGNNELQYYTDRAENLYLEDGCLVIEAFKESYQGKNYTSARINSKGKQEFQYAKVEVRLQVPKGRGTWPAFWMLGANLDEVGWPRCGEIDIMEHVGYEPKTFHCALHTKNKNGTNGQNQKGHKDFEDDVANDFYTITMEWNQSEVDGYDRIHIYINDVLSKTFVETKQLQENGDWPFTEPQFFIINLAIGGNWGGIHGIDDSMFDVPVKYKVDYIKVWELQEE